MMPTLPRSCVQHVARKGGRVILEQLLSLPYFGQQHPNRISLLALYIFIIGSL
jgi:hypothetical protein